MSDQDLLFAQVASMGVPEDKIRAALAARCTSADAILEWCFIHGDSNTSGGDAPVADTQMTPSRGAVGEACSDSQVVYKDECVLSFEGPTSADGLFIHTRTKVGISGPFFVELCQPGESWVRLRRKETRVDIDASDNEPSKMAIGVAGGFVTAASRIERDDKYDVVTVKTTADNAGAALQRDLSPSQFLAQFCTVREISDPSLPPDVANAATTIKNAEGNEFDAQHEAWEETVEPSRFAATLPQPEATPVNMSALKCADCDLTTNLWVNLSDGHVGCGRQQWGQEGITGRSHALAHFTALHKEGKVYPLVAKLGTIQAVGKGGGVSADVYSYHPDEDDGVTDPLLAKHLTHVGIKLDGLTKSEKTTSELNVALNKDHTFQVITEGGTALEPAGGPGLVGLTNLGNTCYMASFVQAIFHTQPFMDRFFLPPLMGLPEVTDGANLAAVVRDVEVQTRRLAIGLLGPPLDCMRLLRTPASGAARDSGKPVYAIKPTLFRGVVAATHRAFASHEQQDAQEFWMVFASLLDRHARSPQNDAHPNPVDSFRYKFRTRTTRPDGSASNASTTELSLSVPIAHDAAINKADLEKWAALPAEEKAKAIEAFDEKVAKKEVTIAADMSNAVPPLPRVPFEACMTAAFSPRTADNGAVQVSSMASFPDYLVVTVSRFMVDEGSWTPKKDDAVVVVPEVLNLAAHRSPPLQPGEVEETAASNASAAAADVMATGGNLDRAAEWVMSRLDDPAALLGEAAGGASGGGGGSGPNVTDGAGEYELRSFVSHAGANVHCGHYVAHVKVDGKWHCFNDEEVAVSQSPPFGRGYVYIFKRKASGMAEV